MAKKTPNSKYTLTKRQVQTLVEAIAWDNLFEEEESLSAFLLLLRAFTYADSTERENMLCDAETFLLPFIGGVDEITDGLVQRSYEALRKRGVR